MKTTLFFAGLTLVLAGCSTEHLWLMAGLCVTGLTFMYSAMPGRGE